jgi:hypothetical protein
MADNSTSNFLQTEREYWNKTGLKQTKSNNSWTVDPEDGQPLLL